MVTFQTMQSSNWRRIAISWMLVLATLLFTSGAFATAASNSGSSSASSGPVQAKSLTDIATNVTTIFPAFVNLVVAICYAAGIGFAAAGVMKFKQHKDNPTQVPLGGPVAMIFIAAALIYMPTLIQSTGQSVFGTTDASSVGSAEGKDPFATTSSGS